MSGGLGKLLGKATDMLGLTDNAGLEAQQRLAEQQASAAKQQAALETLQGLPLHLQMQLRLSRRNGDKQGRAILWACKGVAWNKKQH